MLITLVILVSIVVRLGIGEAFVRFHFHDTDHAARRRVARAATGFLLLTTTAVVACPRRSPPGRCPISILGHTDAGLMRVTVLGLWSFTNLELAYALLRVEERAREYLTASLLNVALTVGLTVWLVVVRDDGARGLLLGNFARLHGGAARALVEPARPPRPAARPRRARAARRHAALRAAHRARRGRRCSR